MNIEITQQLFMYRHIFPVVVYTVQHNISSLPPADHVTVSYRYLARRCQSSTTAVLACQLAGYGLASSITDWFSINNTIQHHFSSNTCRVLFANI